MGVEGTADTRLDGWGLEAGDVNILVQLIQDVLAVSWWCNRARDIFCGGPVGVLVN